jgi:hypothetical protein
MHASLKLTGIALVACAACCAAGVVPVLIASVSVVIVSGAAIKWGTTAVLLAVPVIGLLMLYRHKSKPTAQSTFKTLVANEGCGCGSCDSNNQETPIACSLDAGAFKTRTELIRKLTERHLRHASRTTLRLELTYAPEALSEVRDLVRMEEACCAFLTFDLKHDASGVFVTITAPTAAAAAADDLFAHFALASFTMETSA